MTKDKSSKEGPYGMSLGLFGQLVNAMGGGGDAGNLFPQSDSDDLRHGLRFIPGEVTLARRRGEKVNFVKECVNPCCWYWQFGNRSRTYYWERWNWMEIAGMNRKELATTGFSEETGDAGPCHLCGNPHTSGGHVGKE